jgi:hypothetical protein
MRSPSLSIVVVPVVNFNPHFVPVHAASTLLRWSFAFAFDLPSPTLPLDSR